MNLIITALLFNFITVAFACELDTEDQVTFCSLFLIMFGTNQGQFASINFIN